MKLIQATPDAIAEAVASLQQGQVVAVPTETVYGLAADARNTDGVARIFAIKKRPSYNPLILHVTDLAQAEEYGVFNDTARALAAAFWPGPLTIIVPLKQDAPKKIAPNIFARQESIALRCPAHPVMQQVIKELGAPIAAPSANLSGRTTTTRAQDVSTMFANEPQQPAMILTDKTASKIGLESTIVSTLNNALSIQRHGAITAEQIHAATGILPETSVPIIDSPQPNQPISPGQLARHYAPKTPVRLDATDVKQGEALLAFGRTQFMAVTNPDGEQGGVSVLPDGWHINLSDQSDLSEAARRLYASLHDLDRLGATAIAIMPLPNEGIGIAMNDRLRRAATS